MSKRTIKQAKELADVIIRTATDIVVEVQGEGYADETTEPPTPPAPTVFQTFSSTFVRDDVALRLECYTTVVATEGFNPDDYLNEAALLYTWVTGNDGTKEIINKVTRSAEAPEETNSTK